MKTYGANISHVYKSKPIVPVVVNRPEPIVSVVVNKPKPIVDPILSEYKNIMHDVCVEILEKPFEEPKAKKERKKKQVSSVVEITE